MVYPSFFFTFFALLCVFETIEGDPKAGGTGSQSGNTPARAQRSNRGINANPTTVQGVARRYPGLPAELHQTVADHNRPREHTPRRERVAESNLKKYDDLRAKGDDAIFRGKMARAGEKEARRLGETDIQRHFKTQRIIKGLEGNRYHREANAMVQ